MIARASFVNSWPRRASVAALRCLIEAHFEWPDMDQIVRAEIAREPAGDRSLPGRDGPPNLRRPGQSPAAYCIGIPLL